MYSYIYIYFFFFFIKKNKFLPNIPKTLFIMYIGLDNEFIYKSGSKTVKTKLEEEKNYKKSQTVLKFHRKLDTFQK